MPHFHQRLFASVILGLLTLPARAQEPAQATQQATLAQEPEAPKPAITRCLPGVTPGKEPLYIVDGLPVDHARILSLSPQHIERIDVLSAVQATALYGDQALNGVLIITTKPARKQPAALFKQRQQQPTQQVP